MVAVIRCKKCKKGRLAKAYNKLNVQEAHKDIYRDTKVDSMFTDSSFGEMWEIEYEAVNMPMLLRKHPRQFIELVKTASDRDISILEVQAVKHVIEFKWRTYTREFFLK